MTTPARVPRWFTKAAWYLALVGLSIPFVFPFLWMISSSFKNSTEMFAFPPTLIPETLRWRNFVQVFEYQPFAQQYFNSVYIAALVTIATILVSSMAGYAFARIRFRFSTLIFFLMLTALMMPIEVTIIPNFFFMRLLGLVNTHVPLIVLPVFGSSGVVATFLMRQYFLSLPTELEEAAMIDGMGRFGIFFKIALPLARPALGSVGILTFLYSWNSFLEPLVFVNDLNLFTLPLALNTFTDSYGLPLWHLQLAATTLSVIPILVVYVLAQRQVVESFAMSGMKG